VVKITRAVLTIDTVYALCIHAMVNAFPSKGAKKGSLVAVCRGTSWKVRRLEKGRGDTGIFSPVSVFYLGISVNSNNKVEIYVYCQNAYLDVATKFGEDLSKMLEEKFDPDKGEWAPTKGEYSVTVIPSI